MYLRCTKFCFRSQKNKKEKETRDTTQEFANLYARKRLISRHDFIASSVHVLSLRLLKSYLLNIDLPTYRALFQYALFQYARHFI